MRILNTEPAAIVAAAAALFGLVAAFGVGLPDGASDATLVAIPLVQAAVLAAVVRPVKVPVVVGGFMAVLTAAAAWGLDVTPDQLGAISATLATVGGLLVRSQVIPSGGVVDVDVVAGR